MTLALKYYKFLFVQFLTTTRSPNYLYSYIWNKGHNSFKPIVKCKSILSNSLDHNNLDGYVNSWLQNFTTLASSFVPFFVSSCLFHLVANNRKHRNLLLPSFFILVWGKHFIRIKNSLKTKQNKGNSWIFCSLNFWRNSMNVMNRGEILGFAVFVGYDYYEIIKN